MIEWTETLSVGIPAMDAQHRRLVDLVNALQRAMANGHAEDMVEGIFQELEIYADVHFSAEEEIMARAKYADLDEHRAFHSAFRERLSAFRRERESAKFPVAADLALYLNDWIVNHIREDDRSYGRCVEPRQTR